MRKLPGFIVVAAIFAALFCIATVRLNHRQQLEREADARAIASRMQDAKDLGMIPGSEYRWPEPAAPACLADSCEMVQTVAFCGGRVSAFWTDGKWHDLAGKEIPTTACGDTGLHCFRGTPWEEVDCEAAGFKNPDLKKPRNPAKNQVTK